MPTAFIQQSHFYIEQIDAEIERLQHLRDQVRATIESEQELDGEPAQTPSRRRAAKKGAGKKATGKKVEAKKRGRPKATEAQA